LTASRTVSGALCLKTVDGWRVIGPFTGLNAPLLIGWSVAITFVNVYVGRCK